MLQLITWTTTLYQTGIRLLCVAQNPANGFPARLLDLHGCIITIDAMGCQKGIARQIVDGGSDYLLAVKSNQGELYGNIKDVFECAAREGTLS